MNDTHPLNVRSRYALWAWALALALFPLPALSSEEEAPVEQTEEERLQELEDKVVELEAQLQQARQMRPPADAIRLTGYADVGFFAPLGNGGSGTVQDFGYANFSQYRGQYAWVFMGDMLAPTINSRGEAADLGDLAGAERYDSVHSRGAPGFIVNEVNVQFTAGITDQMLVTTGVNFVPRTGSEFALGDAFDLDIAQLEWIPFANGKTSIFVGKFDSVIGVEYRDRKPTQRFGITPSLLARYTSGTPVGIKARTKLFPGDLLTIALALTNGSSTTEQFHFYDEVDSNAGKTASGRLSVKVPLPVELELGASGEIGSQDRARDSAGTMWFLGFDALFNAGNLALKAQWLRGWSDGRAVDRVYGLRLNNGGYLEANYKITPGIGVLARGEWRDAFVFLSTERAYITKSWRGTVGARFVFNPHLTLKAEYLLNGEYGGVPSIANDVFTSSLLVSY
jgi:hypothetical protein